MTTMADKILLAAAELDKDKPETCDRCRSAVSRIVLDAMERKQHGVSAGLRCNHCGAIWSIRLGALPNDERAKAEAMFIDAPYGHPGETP